MALPGTMRNIMRPTALARPCAPSRHMPSAAQGGGRDVGRPKAAAATWDGPRQRRQRGAAQGSGRDIGRPKAAAATWDGPRAAATWSGPRRRRQRGAAQGGGRDVGGPRAAATWGGPRGRPHATWGRHAERRPRYLGVMGEDIWASLADQFADKAYASVKGLVRTYVMHQQLLEQLPPPPARVLDVGGGAGHQSFPLAQAGYDVTLLDPSPAMLDRARQRLERLPADARRRVTLVQADGEKADEATGARRF